MVFRDVDEIAEDVYRRSSDRLSELRAANQRMAAEIRAMTEQTAANIRQAVEQAEQEAAHSPEEQTTAPTAQRSALVETSRPGAGDPYDQREAIARSAAARRSGTVVTPIDDDGDDEAEYSRRRSWLV